MPKITLWFLKSWKLFKADWLDFVFVYSSYLLVLIFLTYIPFWRNQSLLGNNLIYYLQHRLLVLPILASLMLISLNRSRRQKIHFNDLGLSFPYFLKILMATLLIDGFTALGLFAFILPGLIIASLYIFTPILIMDQKLTIWGAMEKSRKAVMKNLLPIFILNLALLGLNLIGQLFFIFGLLITMPMAMNMLAYAYRDYFKPLRNPS